MIIAYSDETRLPNYALTATTALGVVGIINGPVGRTSTLTVKSGTKTVITFSLVLRGGSTSTIDLYPRIFSAK